MKDVSKIKFLYADRLFPLKGKKVVRGFVVNLFSLEKKMLEEVSYIFCSDYYLLDINRRFLSHDYYTDIITFDLSEGKGVRGEVYISIDRLRDNSNTHGAMSKDEALRVIFHGALHLCGYRDKKKSELTTMREKEDYYLQLFKKNLDAIS